MRRHSVAVVLSLFVSAFMAVAPDVHAAGRQRSANRTVPETPPPRTSFALIDAALANGSINRDTALLYKVFSTFDDPRLPEQFIGDEGPIDSLIMSEVASVFDELSIETQQTLAPFFIPPIM